MHVEILSFEVQTTKLSSNRYGFHVSFLGYGRSTCHRVLNCPARSMSQMTWTDPLKNDNAASPENPAISGHKYSEMPTFHLSFQFIQPLCDGGETREPQGFNRNGTLLIHGSNRSHASLQRFWSANLLRFIYWNSTPWRFQDKLDSSPSPLHEKSLGVSKHVHHGFRYLNYIPSPSSCIVGTLDSWKKKWSIFLPVHFPHCFPPEGQLPTSTSSACCGNEAESIWVNQHLTTAYHMTWPKLAGS